MALVDLDPTLPAADRADAILATLAAAAEADYIGEAVTQLAHGLQAADRARASGDVELMLGALLHDIGHLADPTAPQMDRLGTVDHEGLGERLLLKLGCSERLARMVGGHVDAKRYLMRRPSYASKLSEASRQTLAHQGGPMTDFEAVAFEEDPLHRDLLRVRAWDEAAKLPDADVPGLDFWRPILLDHLLAQEAKAVTAPLETPLTPEQIAAWQRDHLLVLPGVLAGEALDRLRGWVEDLEARPETPGKWMKYFERGTQARQLCRVEDFVPHHAGLAELLCGEALLARLGELLGEPAVLFKEKINFKLPGGAGFTAHQDAPAFDTFGTQYHVTVLIAVDEQTRANGGLEFSDPVPEGVLLPQRADKSVAEATEAELPWYPLDLPAGSVAVFDSFIPHRSDTNRTDAPRRGLYVTYNRARDGAHRAAYFADKRANFPPEVERVPGVDYLATAGRYNVGNPIR
ncbi:MAG: phytanoyl-CoA dioxygenase family protein [Myxococcales bacterium]|nr:phytanoyl-CoA dioxygenase family protein [Myxococcales bacterium]